LEDEFSDKKIQERVDNARGWFYDDVFEKEEIPTIQGHIDSLKKMSKEDFSKQPKSVDARNLSDADFEEIRGKFIKKLTKWKELAEKTLTEKPRPRPPKNPVEAPVETPAEPPKPAEPVAETPAGEAEPDVFGDLANEIEANENKK
jgi:hypothetical protein